MSEYWRLDVTLCHSNFSEKSLVNPSMKNSQTKKIIIIITIFIIIIVHSWVTLHAWWGVIHWELCKILNLEHTTKWYMYKPESVLENEMERILRDFEILIRARKPVQVLINKKKKELAIGWILSILWTTKKSDVDTSCRSCTCNSTNSLQIMVK